MEEKVMILGIDGVSWDLFNKLTNDNIFHNIKKYFDKGITAPLLSTIPTTTYIAIPTFMTGFYPPNISNNPLGNPNNLFNFQKMKEKCFWEYNNLKSCVVNLRCTFPPRSMNGIMISGDLYTPSNKEIYTYPKFISDEVQDFHKNITDIKDVGNKKKYFEKLKNDTKNKLDIFSDLIMNERYDISLFWDGNSDYLLHFLWQRPKLLKDYYEFLDNYIKDILEKSKAKNVILLSDHGFDETYKYSFNLNTWLLEEGYINKNDGKIKKYGIKIIHELGFKIVDSIDFFKKIINNKVNKQKSDEIDDFPFSLKLIGVNYDDTYAQLTSGWWGIEIDYSKFDDNKEYNDFRSELINKLKKITHNGKKIINSIWTSEDLYNFDAKNTKYPDIYFLTRPDYRFNIPLTTSIVERRHRKERPGHHYNSRKGFFMGFGEDISRKKNIKELNICDITPTLLHLFGLAIPSNIDGKVVKNIFKEDSEYYKNDIRYFEKGEKEMIKDSIRDLNI